MTIAVVLALFVSTSDASAAELISAARSALNDRDCKAAARYLDELPTSMRDGDAGVLGLRAKVAQCNDDPDEELRLLRKLNDVAPAPEIFNRMGELRRAIDKRAEEARARQEAEERAEQARIERQEAEAAQRDAQWEQEQAQYKAEKDEETNFILGVGLAGCSLLAVCGLCAVVASFAEDDPDDS